MPPACGWAGSPGVWVSGRGRGAAGMGSWLLAERPSSRREGLPGKVQAEYSGVCPFGVSPSKVPAPVGATTSLGR